MNAGPLIGTIDWGKAQACLLCVQLIVVFAEILLGIAIFWKPEKTIGIQIGFYRRINWKVEPVLMEKEIRNTRIMGVIVLIFGIATLVYIIALSLAG